MVPDLSIIIVNYKTPDLVIDCLRSVFAFSEKIKLEIIVVDNDSGDNSEAIIKTAYPAVQWIQMGYNAGFGRANNAGIRQAKAATFLLLNSDTIIEGDAIQQCYLEFISSSYCACGVQLLNPDRTPQISGNYVMKGALNNLLPLPYLGNFIKLAGSVLKVKKPNIPDAIGEVEVDWINGAFLMVKKNVVDKAGLLDEDFFLYAEEAEWCSRLKKFGRLVIFGQYKVLHLQGETAGKVFNSFGKGYYNLYDRKGLQMMVSNFLRIRKQFGKRWFMFHLVVYLLAIPVFYVFGIFDNLIHGANPFKHFRLANGFAKNMSILLGLSPRIISGRPYFYKLL